MWTMTSPASISTQSPVLQALDADVAAAGVLQVGQQAVGDRRDVAIGTAGRDHHVVGERRFAGDVDGSKVLGLGFIETGEDHLERGLAPERTVGGRRTRSTGACLLTTKCGCQRFFPSPHETRADAGTAIEGYADDGEAFKTGCGGRGARSTRSERAAKAGKPRRAAGFRRGSGRRRGRGASATGSWPPARRGPARASPGRLKTAIGRAPAIACQSRQRWKVGEVVGAHHPDAVDAAKARQEAARGSRRCRSCRAPPRCRSRGSPGGGRARGRRRCGGRGRRRALAASAGCAARPATRPGRGGARAARRG